MIRDKFLLMDDSVVVSTNAASASYIDFLAAGDAMEAGEIMAWRVLVTSSLVGGNGGTLTIQLQTSPNSLFDSNATTLIQSAAISLANLKAQTAGVAPPVNSVGNPISPAVVTVLLPPGMQRYCRAYYTYSAGTDFTTGPTVINELVMDIDKLIGPTLGSQIR